MKKRIAAALVACGLLAFGATAPAQAAVHANHGPGWCC